MKEWILVFFINGTPSPQPAPIPGPQCDVLLQQTRYPAECQMVDDRTVYKPNKARERQKVELRRRVG